MPAPAFSTMLKLLSEGDLGEILTRAAERAEKHGLVDRAALLRTLAEHDAITARTERTQEFRAHLQGPKFQNTHNSPLDRDGLPLAVPDAERRDWIATADVDRWLGYIERGQ